MLRSNQNVSRALKRNKFLTRVFGQAQGKGASNQKWVPMDGNAAAAHVAYACSEVSFIYPISPATSMGENMAAMQAKGVKNIVGNQVCDVQVMQSEGGAAGAVHGALTGGAMASTFTASQGLLLMIPNLYLIAGELTPTVFHISARTVAKHALSIYNDHSDVMACRQTGWAMLCSANPQEVMDLGAVSHMATLKAKIPFMHFFDGNRTSHEIQKLQPIAYETLKQLIPLELVEPNLRSVALNPSNPLARGTGQRPDIWMQANYASQKYYDACPEIVAQCMEELSTKVGRVYKPYQYIGHPQAEKVLVAMGSSVDTIEQTVNKMLQDGEKVGVMKVRMFRPWSSEMFMNAMPESVKRVAVLDRTREEGASGAPLFLDVNVSVAESERKFDIYGGIYGLSGKEFTPRQVRSVFEALGEEKPRRRFTVGINDDVTFTSLPESTNKAKTIHPDTKQCIFWGLGSDGTVGANKEAIKTISDTTDWHAQGNFFYDSKKSGGVTNSHLRFGPEPILARYKIQPNNADYVACHNRSFLGRFNMTNELREGGIFVLNTPYTTLAELDSRIPPSMKRDLAQKNAELYAIDATKLALDIGLGPRINMVMQTAFYNLSGVLPVDKAISLLKQSITNVYGKKGPKVVKMNHAAVDQTREKLNKIEIPAAWATAPDVAEDVPAWDPLPSQKTDFVRNIMEPAMALSADDLPVSYFEPGGVMPVGTTRYERRGAAPEIPAWIPDNCTQCNYCAIVCPHAVIRPFLMSKKQLEAAPDGYSARKAQGGAELAGLQYSIQVAPMDCTGCAVCVESCPDDALYMAPFKEVAKEQLPHWEFSHALPVEDTLTPRVDKYSVKGSQFQQPLLEFHAACAGCGETPYVKLLTQLFGERMTIANASGCSSVWGGTATTHPYTVNYKSGRGPAWGRSLFEDNAEYGLGMFKATKVRRQKLAASAKALLAMENHGMSAELEKLIKEWFKHYDSADKCDMVCNKLIPLLEEEADQNNNLFELYRDRSMFRTQSQWLIGGDGWALDIGSGGLDHVMAAGQNINILVLDTEMYSNTGGQSSKSSVMGAVTKFEPSGREIAKKDLGQQAIQYGNIYVASVAMGADYNQTVKAFKEAEAYNGTSIILAYSPCIDWGIDMKHMMDIQKTAVDTGYWSLYRYHPSNANPMAMDSKKLKKPLHKYTDNENRFKRLERENKERATKLQGGLNEWIQSRHEKLSRMSMDDLELLDFLKKRVGEQTSESVLVLYGSETGNAAEMSSNISHELKRRDIRARVMACDDIDVSDLQDEKMVLLVMATCGQGELPANCKNFYQEIMKEDYGPEFLENTKFAVFGMGDSHYVYFNEVARLFDERLGAVGGIRLLPRGEGNDQDEEKFETEWENWSPRLYNEMGCKEPEKILLPSTFDVVVNPPGVETEIDRYMAPGAKLCDMTENRLLTPGDYDRDTRHYVVDIKDKGMSYEVCDSLGIYAENDPALLNDFLEFYGMNEADVLQINDLDPERKEPMPAAMTAGQLFGQCLDIFGRPKRRFYELMELLASDPKEKAELEFLLSKEGDDLYRTLGKATAHHLDIMKRYQSAKPNVAQLLDYVPKIKPRLYSIASSPNMHPDEIHMCIIQDDWNAPKSEKYDLGDISGRYQAGLCSTFLKTTGVEPPSGNTSLMHHKKTYPKVVAKVNAAAVNVPADHTAPLVMAGLGTGLAPIRGLVQDRVQAHKNGEKVAPMAILFGARYRASEWLYEEEWNDLVEQGLVTHLLPAFSRDQKQKIYVQDKIKENPDMIYDYLVNQKGSFYACGSGAVNDLKFFVADVMAEKEGITKEEALQKITQMQIEGRYNIEAW